jgi:hypothetical protein
MVRIENARLVDQRLRGIQKSLRDNPRKGQKIRELLDIQQIVEIVAERLAGIFVALGLDLDGDRRDAPGLVARDRSSPQEAEAPPLVDHPHVGSLNGSSEEQPADELIHEFSAAQPAVRVAVFGKLLRLARGIR